MPFCKPVTLGHLKVKVKKSVHIKTRQQTDWSVSLWMEWRLSQTNNAENSTDTPPRLCNKSMEEMSSWLSMFVVEIH